MQNPLPRRTACITSSTCRPASPAGLPITNSPAGIFAKRIPTELVITDTGPATAKPRATHGKPQIQTTHSAPSQPRPRDAARSFLAMPYVTTPTLPCLAIFLNR